MLGFSGPVLLDRQDYLKVLQPANYRRDARL